MRYLLTVCALSCLWAAASLEAGETNDTSRRDGEAETGVASDEAIRALFLRLVSDDDEVVEQAIVKLAKTGDPRLERFMELYRQGSVYNWPDEDGAPRIVVNEETVEDDDFNEFAPLFDPLTGAKVMVDGKHARPDVFDLEDMAPGRKLRKLVNAAKYLLRLFSPDLETRLSGVKKCGDPPYNSDALPFLREIAEEDPHPKARRMARESLLLIRFAGRTPDATFADRVAAIRELGEMNSLRALPRIEDFLKGIERGEEEFASVAKGDLSRAKVVSAEALKRIGEHADSVELAGNLFRGVSYGSVLILMALGLAITFGLMGVINMAHGELMMIGAYATYETQLFFGHTPDTPADAYYLWALPVAFFAAALVGLIMESLVVRHLYNRPLESLLATWGVGLILIQAARLRYGDNIGVNAPSWARGGVEVSQDLILPHARLYIIVLCAACVFFVYFVMRKTKRGMLMRATMQNRDMAAGLGVRTRGVDRFTFALGSGIAGVAGYGWTLIGGVTPDMGQTNFIVDSFLVVVTGGVGELAGVIFSGLGIGMFTKWIEPLEFGKFVIGPVWAKVILLAGIVGFIQYRPSGLFAPKGRAGDD